MMYTSLPKTLLNAISNDTKIIIIEGPDSVGKTTMMKNAISTFDDYGVKLIPVRCPDNREDVVIRQVIMSQGVAENPMCQSFLFLADFVYAYEKIMKPHLESGDNVKFIFDRFLPSTCSYQNTGLDTLNVVLTLLAPEMAEAFSHAMYIYMDPVVLETHIARTKTKAANETNHLDPVNDEAICRQISKYRQTRLEHHVHGILGSRQIEHFPVS